MLEGGKILQVIEEARRQSATGRHAEAVELASQCISALREEITKGGECARDARRLLLSALQTAGISLYEQRNLDAAMKCLQEAVSISEDLEDMRGLGAALHEIALIAGDWHNFPQAAELSRGAIRADTLAKCEAHTPMQGLAVFDQLTGNFDEAEVVLLLVRESCEARGDLIGLGQALHELGLTAAVRNHPAEAIGYFVKAMRVKRISGDTRGLQQTRQILQQFLDGNPEAARNPLL